MAASHDPRLSRRLIPAALVPLAVLAALAVALATGVRVPLAQQLGIDRPVPVAGGGPVAQSFTVAGSLFPDPGPAPDLEAIELRIGTYHGAAIGELELALFRDEPGGPVERDPAQALRRSALGVAGLADNAARQFAFEPLPVRPGDRLVFEIRARDAPPGQAPALWSLAGDRYAGGELRVDGRPAGGDLCFRALGRQRGGDLVGRIAHQATWWKPRGADRPAVLAALAALVLAAGTLAAAHILGPDR